MKGNEKLLGTLNSLLSDELTAISQYMVHSEMCANWGYEITSPEMTSPDPVESSSGAPGL